MMITALHIKSDGTYETFSYDPKSNDSLDVLKERVGGWLESAPIIDNTLTMYCNEEGKILGLPRNSLATDMLLPYVDDWIAGDVVLVGAPDDEGYDTDLPEAFKESSNG